MKHKKVGSLSKWTILCIIELRDRHKLSYREIEGVLEEIGVYTTFETIRKWYNREKLT